MHWAGNPGWLSTIGPCTVEAGFEPASDPLKCTSRVQAVRKRSLIFLFGGAVGLDDLSRRVFRFLRIYAAGGGVMGRIWQFRAALWPDTGAKGGVYALIAAIGGMMPMMLMTRLRL